MRNSNSESPFVNPTSPVWLTIPLTWCVPTGIELVISDFADKYVNHRTTSYLLPSFTLIRKTTDETLTSFKDDFNQANHGANDLKNIKI